jgi:hypothetical protein
MPQIDLHDLIAQEMEPSIRIRITPDHAISISQIRWEERMADILAFCVDLDVESRLSWQMLQEVTGGNGDMAKLLIALGEMLQVWCRHPSLDFPELWTTQSVPMILAGSSVKTAAGRVPKPSRGDLEKGMVPCSCCRLSMGPPDSIFHDLLASIMNPKLCTDCEAANCDVGGPCQQYKTKEAEVRKPPEEEEEAEHGGAARAANELSAYEDLFR